MKAALLARRLRSGALAMPEGAALLRLALLLTALAPLPWGLTFALALASETIERTAFYAGLEPSTPASRMVDEARRALATG